MESGLVILVLGGGVGALGEATARRNERQFPFQPDVVKINLSQNFLAP